MAMLIKYRFLSAEINHGTEDNPDTEQVFLEKTIECQAGDLAANEKIAKAEAYNGQYTVEDDGQPAPVAEPAADEILNAMLGVTV